MAADDVRRFGFDAAWSREAGYPARTVRVGEFFGCSTLLPWKRARTLNVPVRVARGLPVIVTLLRYVQSDLSVTLREEIVLPFFWKRTFTLPEQITERVAAGQ